VSLPSPPTPPETTTDGGTVETLDNFLRNLLPRQASRGHLVHIEAVPARTPRYADPDPPLPRGIQDALRAQGIDRLYLHQVEALAQARAGRIPHVRLGRYRRFRASAIETWLQELETGGLDAPANARANPAIPLRRHA